LLFYCLKSTILSNTAYTYAKYISVLTITVKSTVNKIEKVEKLRFWFWAAWYCHTLDPGGREDGM